MMDSTAKPSQAGNFKMLSCIQIIFDCQVGQEGADQEKRNLLDTLPGRVLEQIHKGRTTPVFLCGQA
ncbi:hypothetical protein [Desulfotignum balticum]|uniref:hypothetical protein n=1 Tax=Desulfotignum balticum TaxID=115781 RepID=UPI00041FEEA2|nr:hypothetical protein [Desulfotignum balticum]